MKRQWIFVLAIVLGLGAGTWWLIEMGKGIRPVEVGSDAPEFRAVNLHSGDTVSFKKHYQGKVVLVNLWATWCIPCRAEMPAMERLYKELGPRGFRILAISIDETGPKDVQDFVNELGITFEVLHDRSADIQRVYQTTGVPESFLLDKDGVIVKKVIGEHPWSSESNRRIIADLLGGE